MKNQALLSSKDRSKKLECRLLQFLFGALSVRNILATLWALNNAHKMVKCNAPGAFNRFNMVVSARTFCLKNIICRNNVQPFTKQPSCQSLVKLNYRSIA